MPREKRIDAYLVSAHVQRVADAALGGRTMRAVLRAVAGDHLVVAGVAAQREADLDDVVAALHQHQDTLHLLLALLQAGALDVFDQLVLGDLAAAMEEVLDHVEEARILGGGHIGQPLGDLVVRIAAGGRLHGDARVGQGAHQQTGDLLLDERRLGESLQVEHFLLLGGRWGYTEGEGGDTNKTRTHTKHTHAHTRTRSGGVEHATETHAAGNTTIRHTAAGSTESVMWTTATVSARRYVCGGDPNIRVIYVQRFRMCLCVRFRAAVC